jgi:hypothetical protein
MAIGEIIVRLDAAFMFFQSSRMVQFENGIRNSAELTLIENGVFPILEKDLRIMVLGDSRIQGLGIEPEKIFSQQLQLMLRSGMANLYSNVYVLDVSCGGNNTLRNKMTYFAYVDRFKPHIVILCYTYGDVYGDQDIRKNNGKTLPGKNEKTVTGKRQLLLQTVSGKKNLIISRVLTLLYNSKLVQFILVNLNMELKLCGIILPGSEFYHEVFVAYSPDFYGWKRSKTHLQDIIKDCNDRGIRLIVFTMPELNMLRSYQVFNKIEKEVSSFFQSNGVIYLNGVRPFLGLNSDDYAISRYDAHPNYKAHSIMAQHVYEIISKLSGALNENNKHFHYIKK